MGIFSFIICCINCLSSVSSLNLVNSLSYNCEIVLKILESVQKYVYKLYQNSLLILSSATKTSQFLLIIEVGTMVDDKILIVPRYFLECGKIGNCFPLSLEFQQCFPKISPLLVILESCTLQ